MAATTIRIRPYLASDAAGLTQVHNASFPADQLAAGELNRRLLRIGQTGGWAWSLVDAGRPVGYAQVTAVPGLDGVTEMNGCIGPADRRRGLGGHLLEHILAALPRPQVRQVSYATDQMRGPAARFLQAQGFVVEHVEWQMVCPIRPEQPEPLPWPDGYEIQHYRQAVAVRHFRRLYDHIFTGQPWFQPYTSNQEVVAELNQPSDLLFLQHQGQDVGLAWLRWPIPGTAEIEPFGLAPAYRGQGLGRQFLEWVLFDLGRRGVRLAQVGVWQDNEPAIHLYRRVGFERHSTLTYLAIDL